MRRLVVALMVWCSVAHAEPSASELFERLTAHYAGAKKLTATVWQGQKTGGQVVVERGTRELGAQYFFMDGHTDFAKLSATYANPPGWPDDRPSEYLRIDGPGLHDLYVLVDPTDGHVTRVSFGHETYRFDNELLDPAPAPASAKALLARVATRYARVKRYTARFSRGDMDNMTDGSLDIVRDDKAVETWTHSGFSGEDGRGTTTIVAKDLPEQYLFMDSRMTLSALKGTFEQPRGYASFPSARTIKLDGANRRDVYLLVDETDAHIAGVVVGHQLYGFSDEVLDAPQPPSSPKVALAKVIAHYAKAKVLSLELEFGGDEHAAYTGTAIIDRRGNLREERTRMRGGSGPQPPFTVVAVAGKDPVRFTPRGTIETLAGKRDSIWDPYAFFRDAAALGSAKVTYLVTRLSAIPYLDLRVEYGTPAKVVYLVVDPISYRVTAIGLPTEKQDQPKYASWRITSETLDPPVAPSTFVAPN